MRLNPLELLSRLNSSYWFVPLVVTLGGVGAALLLLLLDEHLSLPAGGALELLHQSSPEGARALLSAVIGAMITAVSVTFSVTIVALTVAAQHFGPRVLNSFVRHTSAQVVLGTFMATFAYAVLVMGAVRGTEEAPAVPELAVGGAIVLVVLSVGALIFYVHHVSTSLQIGELASELASDFRRAVTRLHDSAQGADRQPQDVPAAPRDASRILARETGYVQRIDFAAIASAAKERDAVVWIRREPGAFLLAGTPLALVQPPASCDDALVETVRRACIVGADRTLWQDPEFSVKQLVEIALRALSPGVNEPFTAMTCIDRLTEGLACAAQSVPPPTRYADEDGRVRVYCESQPFGTLLRAAFDPIRLFADTNPAIYARLLDAIVELAFVANRPSDLEDLRHQADLVRRAAEQALTDPDDRTYVQRRYEVALAQFSGEAVSSRR